MTENRVQQLINERRSTIAVYHEFKLAFKPASTTVYVFFEGLEDVSYYMPELRRRWADTRQIRNFTCSGKPTLIEVYNKVKANNKEKNTLFFADKDLDNFLPVVMPTGDNLFVTEFYSIENYLVTEDCFRIIWSELFCLPAFDARVNPFATQFTVSHDDFIDAMLPIMAWILMERRNGTKLNLNNINLNNVITFSPNFLIARKHGSFNTIKAACNLNNQIKLWMNLKPIIRFFKKVYYKEYLRGKYELWFFISFVNKVATILNGQVGLARPNTSTNLTGSNAIAILAGRVPYPSKLMRFLNLNEQKLNNEPTANVPNKSNSKMLILFARIIQGIKSRISWAFR